MPSSRRKPGSICCCFDRLSSRKHIPVFFHSPSWRAGHFSLLAQREVTKRKGTPAVAVAGLLPGDYVRTLRGSLTARPCAGSELGAIHRADPFGAFPSRPHRGRGGPRRSEEADVLSAEADASLRSLGKNLSSFRTPHAVIPAKAGIQLLLWSSRRKPGSICFRSPSLMDF